jgi:hypothetical protein
MLPGPAPLRTGLTAPAGSALAAALLLFVAEALEGRELVGRVLAWVVDARRRRDRRLRILPEQELRLDLARERRLGAHPARRTDQDHQQGRRRRADDDADEKLNHAFDRTEMA